MSFFATLPKIECDRLGQWNDMFFEWVNHAVVSQLEYAAAEDAGGRRNGWNGFATKMRAK